MVNNVKQLRIFIASPCDCEAERQAVHRLCREDPTIVTICRKNHISLDVIGWESVCPNMGRPQSIINAEIEKLNPDWFVFVLWHRFGSEAGLGMTGTLEEWELARQLNEKGGGFPKVSIYFNKKPALSLEYDIYQIEALRRFRDTIFNEFQALAGSFDGTRDFEEKFRAHLTENLLNLDGEYNEITFDRLRHELLASSNVLLNYQRTLGDEQQIERIEFEDIVQRIDNSEQSTTLILGGPGSGKSSLLSTIAQYFTGKGIPILAIKADTLTAEVNTAEDLRKALGLSLDAGDCVLAIAEKENIIVIIDQLDAVSDLLDRKSGRLNVLLNLIQKLSNQKGINIIASSREFEYHHDVRLNNINAEKTTLELPAWEQISPILEQAGHETAGMGDELKELLRIPLHLKIYLDVAKPGAVFHSLHALQEELWEQRVLAPHAPHDTLLLLNELAMRMADEESLWLPIACTDSHVEARRFLEQNDILVPGQDGLTIGFRHQTYYDYTLTRAFSRDSVSLADYVIGRQDGLFVRPTFLSGLHYLRTTSAFVYHKQLQIFFETGLRPHLFALLIEFLGSQKNPDDAEAYLLLPLLNSDLEGPKVLGAVTGSPGWFNRLRGYEGIKIWMGKAIESASHCVPFLAAAASFAGIDVLELIKEYWLDDVAYDTLTLNVLLNFRDWDSNNVLVAEKLVNRSKLWIAGTLIERIAEIHPELALRVLRASLDGKLSAAIKEVDMKKPLKEDEPCLIRNHDLNSALENLLENRVDFIDIERLAEEAPKGYLQWIWPWFLDVVNRVASAEHDFVLEYRSDSVIYSRFERIQEETVVMGLKVAIKKITETETQYFLQFLDDNISSDLLSVHRYLARGLAQITEIEPLKVLEYLLGDPRRLCIGDHNDCHRYSKRMITNVFPNLGQSDRLLLEEAALSFKRYKKIVPEWGAEERRDRIIWNREHRLRLLKAFPLEYLSPRTRRVIEEEERALPGLSDYDGRVSVGCIGPRMKADEMAKASDDELINLFNELPDGTQWDNPKCRGKDLSRGGGSVQQSREFKELVKNNPKRAVRMIANLKPGCHESYAGAGLEGLAETDLPIDELTQLVENLDKRGFAAGYFREGAASALEKLAERENGLPDGILLLLEKWLAEHPEPNWPNMNEPQDDKQKEIKDSVLFGTDSLFFLPNGRGTILRAITAGYLEQRPPDYNNWVRLIESRLGHEQHPDVWALTMMHMPMLFNTDPDDATRIYDAVINTCPLVLEKQVAIYSIARVIPWCHQIKAIQDWLDKIKACSLDTSCQIYCEMLFLYYFYKQDSWSSDRIMSILSDGDDENALLGLAYGASHLWHGVKSRTMAMEILCCLASHHDKSIQHAVADIFRYNRDQIQLDSQIRKVIQSVSCHRPILLEVAVDLVELLQDYTGIEPELVSEVCQKVIQAGGSDIGNISTSLALLAEPLTNIAITLHRHIEYREVGLQMFEDLISMNVRETHAALEILDRKPMKTSPLPYMRRRRRKIRS